ncbi:MAG: magnesium/cobalt efflux protein [Micavibrio sp.]|nr:magnesium/cobalt efflux protein [Micavibrio sp.]
MKFNTQLSESTTRNDKGNSFLDKFKIFQKSKGDTVSLKEAVDAYLEDATFEEDTRISDQEKLLISNVVGLRDLKVTDVMIPRADIIAIDVKITEEGMLSLLTEKQHSRFPVYEDNLDNVLGTIHIKDIVSAFARGEKIEVRELIREVPFASPAMPILDLMVMMQHQRRHMILVIDEYGGIDGLVTIGDVIENVIGEIQDEYDFIQKTNIIDLGDGVYIADARYDINELENLVGKKLYDEEEEDLDTVGGLIASIAGRLPARGEVFKEESLGMSFEVLDADPRRLKRVRITSFDPVTESSEAS